MERSINGTGRDCIYPNSKLDQILGQTTGVALNSSLAGTVNSSTGTATGSNRNGAEVYNRRIGSLFQERQTSPGHKEDAVKVQGHYLPHKFGRHIGDLMPAAQAANCIYQQIHTVSFFGDPGKGFVDRFLLGHITEIVRCLDSLLCQSLKGRFLLFFIERYYNDFISFPSQNLCGGKTDPAGTACNYCTHTKYLFSF